MVMDKKPATLAVAAELHDDYVASRREEVPFNKSFNRQGNHKGNDGSASEKKSQDGGREKSDPGKSADKRPSNNPKQLPKFDPEKGPRCFNCNQYGHLASKCPDKAESVNAVNEIIYNGTIDGKKALRMRPDSGADRSIVHRRMVPTSALSGKKGFFKSFSGHNSQLDLAEVTIAIAGEQYIVEVAVSDTLQYDALLGMDLFKPLQQKASGSIMSVSTRAQLRQAAEEQQEVARREKEDAATLTPLPTTESTTSSNSIHSPDTDRDKEEDDSSEIDPSPISDDDGDEEEDDLRAIDLPPFLEDLFLQVRPKQKISKSKKREAAQAYSSPVSNSYPIDGGADKPSELQHSDSTLETARSAADGKLQGFFWEDGLLYRWWTPQKDEEAIQQLVLPQQYRQSVLETAHSIPMAGHLGQKKTTSRVQQRFFWPRLREDVAEMCKGCVQCQKTARVRKHRAPMIHLPVMDRPFQRIAMDMVGPLPRSKSGHKYILTICDYGSRYPEAIPLKSTDSKHVAEALIPFFSHVGIPQEILTDCGANFTSKLMKELYNLLGIHAIKTSPYHPQTDRLVERFNTTMKSMLRKVIQKFDKQWDKALPYLMFAYREVPQESTGFSPFELLYGRKVRGPLDVLKESWEAKATTPESSVSYLMKVRDRLESVAKIAQASEKAAKQTQKQWYDRNARERSFQLGDQVLVLMPAGLKHSGKGHTPVQKR